MKTSVIEVHDMLSVLSVVGVEERIGKVPGVESVTVNFAAGSATVRYDETRLQVADIKAGVRQIGYESPGETSPEYPGESKKSHAHPEEPSSKAPPSGPAAAAAEGESPEAPAASGASKAPPSAAPKTPPTVSAAKPPASGEAGPPVKAELDATTAKSVPAAPVPAAPASGAQQGKAAPSKEPSTPAATAAKPSPAAPTEAPAPAAPKPAAAAPPAAPSGKGDEGHPAHEGQAELPGNTASEMGHGGKMDLAAGVRIYEYLPRMLHAKTVVIDGTRATLGTANLDYRSFFLNYELLLAMAGTRECALLEQHFFEDLSESQLIVADTWARRRWAGKLLEGVGWVLRRWL